MSAPGDFQAPFAVQERLDGDGALRLILSGELDLAVADQLSRRIGDLARERQVIRLDLARLEFMDSSGLRVLIGALMDSRRHGFRLEIGAEVSDQVRRLVECAGVGDHFWPEGTTAAS